MHAHSSRDTDAAWMSAGDTCEKKTYFSGEKRNKEKRRSEKFFQDTPRWKCCLFISDALNASRLLAALSIYSFKTHAVALTDMLLDLTMMDEIVSAIIARNKAVALLGIKPLDGTFHRVLLSCAIHSLRRELECCQENRSPRLLPVRFSNMSGIISE